MFIKKSKIAHVIEKAIKKTQKECNIEHEYEMRKEKKIWQDSHDIELAQKEAEIKSLKRRIKALKRIEERRRRTYIDTRISAKKNAQFTNEICELADKLCENSHYLLSECRSLNDATKRNNIEMETRENIDRRNLGLPNSVK